MRSTGPDIYSHERAVVPIDVSGVPIMPRVDEVTVEGSGAAPDAVACCNLLAVIANSECALVLQRCCSSSNRLVMTGRELHRKLGDSQARRRIEIRCDCERQTRFDGIPASIQTRRQRRLLLRGLHSLRLPFGAEGAGDDAEGQPLSTEIEFLVLEAPALVTF